MIQDKVGEPMIGDAWGPEANLVATAKGKLIAAAVCQADVPDAVCGTPASCLESHRQGEQGSVGRKGQKESV